jgi:hypothetical protein
LNGILNSESFESVAGTSSLKFVYKSGAQLLISA